MARFNVSKTRDVPTAANFIISDVICTGHNSFKIYNAVRYIGTAKKFHSISPWPACRSLFDCWKDFCKCIEAVNSLWNSLSCKASNSYSSSSSFSSSSYSSSFSSSSYSSSFSSSSYSSFSSSSLEKIETDW